METAAKQKIVIIGCGNVAWHLAKHLQSLKKFEVFVYNHKPNPSLNEFKSKLKCKVDVGLDHVIENASCYFICIPDRFISETAKRLHIKDPNALLLHTSGSCKLSELGERIHDTGVFYPLQTFSKATGLDWSTVPVIIEHSTEQAEARIRKFALQFSKTVISLSYKERLKLHLSAVFVNNFTNALYVVAHDLVMETSKTKDLNFDLLLPLIKQTTEKIAKLNPRAAQTGPAKRNDEVVLKKHLELLSKHTELKKLYKQLSKLIVKQQKR
jgi:predicted short-subunit dehydrogenase-like oxidoreductase (DUF2520 family)